MNLDLRSTIASLKADLQRLVEQRNHIDGQITNRHLALRSLVREVDDDAERKKLLDEIDAARRKPEGLTHAVSETLRQTPQSLSANEVRYWLEREGFDLSEYSQPLAVISVTLRRLVNRGLVKTTRKNRKVTYKWIGD